MEQRALVKKEVENLLRLVACLLGAVCGFVVATVALLVISFFADVGLPAAFFIQILAAVGSAAITLWRSA